MKKTLLLAGLITLSAAFSAAHAAVISGPFTYGGHTYVQISSNTWSGAEAEALTLGGHLATVNDAAENAWIAATFPSTSSWGNWIGYNDVAVEGSFVWTSGETPGYTNWAAGEPNDCCEGEDGVQMYADGSWNDLVDRPTDPLYAPPAVVEIAGVPEGGSAAAMLGAALVGIAGLRRKLKMA